MMGAAGWRRGFGPSSKKETMTYFLTVLGYGALAVLFYQLLQLLYAVVYVYFLATPKNLRQLGAGSWAVVTGSTDGIGKGYAQALARKGFNVCLIARNPEKLRATADEIHADTGVDVKCVAFDFSNTDLNAYESFLYPHLDSLDIGVLVNNVGLSHVFPDEFTDMVGGAERHRDVLSVNTLPTTLLCYRVLKQMKSRRRGIVVNVSSSICYANAAYWGVYSASKRYIVQLTSILRKEYGQYGITLQCVSPMMVCTNMSKVRKPSLFVPTANEYATQAVNSIGHISETHGFWSHELQAHLLFKLLPEFAFDLYWDNISRTVRNLARKKMARIQ